MAYASFHQNPETPVRQREITDGGLSQGKALAKIYGYMGIGLLLTGVVAFFGAWLFSSQINKWLAAGLDNYSAVGTWFYIFIGSWIVSLIAILVLSFVIPVRAARSGKSLWVPYILYCFFMGVLLTTVLLAGIPFWMIGEAFGLTCLAFGAMFAIGWFTKKDISILSYIAMLLLFGVLITALAGMITFLIRGATADQRFWFDVAIQGAMILVIMLITAVDTWRIKRIIANAGESENIYLYGAYVMYADFIALLLRILLLIARMQGRK
ncbi:MAG: Bax inhibitor-1 family protein [Bacilli bacterium]|nr:Bax inhibitor-1 family protein [Bacilli bacterium]